MGHAVSRRRHAVVESLGRAALRRDILRAHRAAYAARDDRRRLSRNYLRGLQQGEVDRRSRRSERSLLALRRSRLDVYFPAGLFAERQPEVAGTSSGHGSIGAESTTSGAALAAEKKKLERGANDLMTEPAYMRTEAEDDHAVGSTKLFAWIWVWLLLLTAIEVFLAYERVEVHLMITILLGLSLIKSALIMSYFMHLRFERLGLFLILIPAMVFCICMMLIMFYPDSIRLMDMRPH